MSIRQDIGPVSAYALAKEKGYQGTEEEFEQAMANVGTNIGEIREAIDTFNDVTVPTATQAVTDEGIEQVGLVNAAGTAQVEAVEEKGTIEIGAVEAAGTAQISAVNSAGSTQVGNVNTAGSKQVSAVNGAGTTQVGNVNTAGGTQVAAVQAKGDEVIASIPEDYSELTQEVSDLNQALKQTNDDLNTAFYRNLFNQENAVTGGYFGSNGSITTEPSSAYTPNLIPIDNTKTYKATATGYSIQVCTYNSDREFIERAYNGTVSEFTFGSNVAFVKFSLFGHAFPDGFIFADSNSYTYLENSNGMVLKETSLPPLEINPDETTFLDANYDNVPIDSLDNVQYLPDKNCYPSGDGNSIYINSQSGLNSYVIEITNPTIIYVVGPIASGNYRSISVLKNVTERAESYYSGTDGTRYRDADNNLPTAENPLVLSEGDAVFFTTISGFTIMTNYNGNKYTFPELVVKQDQIEPDDSKQSFYRYETNANLDNQFLSVFFPSESGEYIGFVMNRVHWTGAKSFVWRVKSCDLYEKDEADNFTLKYTATAENNYLGQLFTSGEWENAIGIQGRPDFMGGTTHGDALSDGVFIMVDGKPLSQSETMTKAIPFNSIKVIQKEILYDPSNEDDAVFDAVQVWIFENEKLTIEQTHKALTDLTLSSSYTCMVPVNKLYGNHFSFSGNPSLFQVDAGSTDTYNNEVKAQSGTPIIFYYWGDHFNAIVESICTKPDGSALATMVRDNNGGAYNKGYVNWLPYGQSSWNISAGETVNTKNTYKLTYNGE